MAVKIKNWVNENRKVIQELGMFKVIEHQRDLSVDRASAQKEYFSSKMNVRCRQVEITLNGTRSVIVQAGAMQLIVGGVEMETGVKSAKGFLGAMVNAAVTNETAVKPEYKGNGQVILEPTYKHIILQNVEDWGPGGLVVEDGMFLASEGGVKHEVIQNTQSLGTALLSDEGLYNLSFKGQGVVALESYVPFEELVEYELENDVLKVDGNMAVCWSGSLNFSVEKTTKSLLGSLASGEGFVNVYRGTGKVWVSPVSGTGDSTVHTMSGGSDSAKKTSAGGVLGGLLGK